MAIQRKVHLLFGQQEIEVAQDRTGIWVQALTTMIVTRIPLSDNRMPLTPSLRVAPGGRGPHGPHKVRWENRQLALAGVGLNSFGLNPTANLAGA
jgi:hypothetical protein